MSVAFARLAVAAATAALLMSCGGGDDATLAPITRGLPIDRLSVAASIGAAESVAVLPEVDADQGPYAASTSDPACATATTLGSSTVVVTGVATGKCSITIRSAGATVELPVEVYDPFVLDTGELVLTYTNRFTQVGEEIILGGVTFHQPIPKDGFYAFGTAMNDEERNERIGDKVVFVVKGKNDTAMVVTHAYEFVRRLSHVSYYRPICPSGYKALGWAANVPEPFASSSLGTACVRRDLTSEGKNTRPIGVPFGTAGNSVAWYAVDPPEDVTHAGAHFAPGTFIASFAPPTDLAVVLNVRLPVVADAPRSVWRPTLPSSLCPPSGWETRSVLTKSILVPFTHIANPGAIPAPTRAATSPFYRLERHVNFKMMACRYNDTSLVQPASFTITSGITNTDSQTFETRTGIEVSYEAGIELKDIFNSKVTTKLSLEFGYSHMTEVSELLQFSGTFNFDAVPQATTAIFQDNTVFRLYRHAGDHVELASTTPAINGMSFVVTQYPSAR